MNLIMAGLAVAMMGGWLIIGACCVGKMTEPVVITSEGIRQAHVARHWSGNG